MKSPVRIALFLLIALVSCARETSTDLPNFVWIVSEDNSTHYMELFDPHGIATPNLEKMAEQGVLFTRAFCNAPVCSVARSALISACYGPRTGTQFHRRSRLVPLPEGVEMFPACLKRAGYYTTNNQKEDYNFVKGKDVWDESSGRAHWSHRKPGQPFFHMQSYPVSHESSLHFDTTLMESYQPVCSPDSVFLLPNHPDTDLFRFTAAYYLDRMLAVDSIVGQVIRQLEEAGELERTFVFYFGDNGGVLPGSKGYLYETGLQVPLVVRIPEQFRHLVDLKRGESTDGFVSFVDFGPTLLNLAGIGLPGGIDGIPFMGRGITRKALAERDVTYGYADRFDEKYDLVRSVRRGNMKYMRSYQPFNPDALQNNYRYLSPAYRQWRDLYLSGRLNAVQAAFFEPRDPEALYDLSEDPYETVNLAADPAYRQQLSEMRTLMVTWVKGMPDLSFYPESALFREAFDHPVLFGQQHQKEIGDLVDIADLELLPYTQAREGIRRALDSEDPLHNYWGLIVCSAFGKEAEEFAGVARDLCSHTDPLVRTRAAEFLGLTGLGDPIPVLLDALYGTNDGVEALLILNSVVLLMDGPRAFHFVLEKDRLSPDVIRDQEVQRRLEYIASRTEHTGG